MSEMSKKTISYKTIVLYLFILIVFTITAYNSSGYYHADEQYQIIEFAGLKLGTHQPMELAWEFQSKIRPMIQPTLCVGILKGLDTINISEPYHQAFVLRLISAIFSILCISFFIRSTTKMMDEKFQFSYVLLSYFLWFIPLISVRFSSETWSGLLFILGLALHFTEGKESKSNYLIGLVFGLSFLFRFQMAFAILGFLLWLLFIHKSKLKSQFQIATGFLGMVFLGILIDSWFYNEWVFTPWNYFYINIIDDAASNFGISSWVFYFQQILIMPSIPIGVLIIAAFMIILVFRRTHFILWVLIPFVLIHSLIPHKEDRFLFPLVFLIPLMLITAYQIVEERIHEHFLKKWGQIILVGLFAIVNLIGVVIVSQKSAGLGRMKITQYIHNNYPNQRINLIHCPWANPYNPWNSLPVKFYLEKDITSKQINNPYELADSLFTDGAVNLLVVRNIELRDEKCAHEIQKKGFVLKCESIQPWIMKINHYYNGISEEETLSLYQKDH